MADPKIRIKRSSTPNKVPGTDQLLLGELAINTNDGKLYLEQDQFGSVGIATTVVAVNPWNVGVGSLAYDINFTAGNVGVGTTNTLAVVGSNNTTVLAAGIVTAYKFYGDGSALTGISGGGGGAASVTMSTSAPSSPSSGDLWWDTDIGELYVYYADGDSNQWVEANGGSGFVSISDDAPSSPNNGDLWWESDTGTLKIYYNDGDSAQWIDANSGILNGIFNPWTTTTMDGGVLGISTTSRVGVGTTNARYLLEVGAVGASGTSLLVNGDARVTGILTVGSSSVTLDGNNNLVNVGTALTIGHTQGLQFYEQNLHQRGFEVNQINASGIITATSGLDAIGIHSAGAPIAVGVITSLNFIGSGNTFAVSNGTVDISISGGGVAVTATAPSGPDQGDLWWNSDTGNLSVYYEDNDTNQWVSAGAVGAQGAQGATGAAGAPYSGTEGQLLQHNGSAFVGIGSTNFADYVADRAQGYYAYTTDYYTVGTANTVQELVENVWTLLEPQVASDGLYDHQPTEMTIANSGDPWVGSASTIGTGQTEFSLAGTRPGSMCLVRTLIRFEPDVDETDLDLRLHFTTNTATQGTGLTNFNTTKQALVMTTGAGVTYTSEEIISFFVGDTLYGHTKSDAGRFCIEANASTDGILEIQGVTVMVDI